MAAQTLQDEDVKVDADKVKSMDRLLQDYRSAGYVITQPAYLMPYNQELYGGTNIPADLIPDQILSVGFCGSEFAPLFSGTKFNELMYASFGIPEQLIPQIDAWSNARLNQEVGLGYPNIFFTLTSAREYVNNFVQTNALSLILGIGVHRNDLPIQLVGPEDPSNPAKKYYETDGYGFSMALARNEPLAEGEQLGFDVIGLEFGIFHSWQCYGALVVQGFEAFDFRPNAFGLIGDKHSADLIAGYANTNWELFGGVTWLPALVTRYTVVATSPDVLKL